MNSEEEMHKKFNELADYFFKERLLEILPPKADERNMKRVSEDWSLDTMLEVDGWNAYRTELLKRAGLDELPKQK